MFLNVDRNEKSYAHINIPINIHIDIPINIHIDILIYI
jgi:hypothetical protein